MKITKKQMQESILFFANLYGLEKQYNLFFNKNLGIPELLKRIIYEMFINKFSYTHCSDEHYEHYKIILEATLELKNKGFIKYGET